MFVFSQCNNLHMRQRMTSQTWCRDQEWPPHHSRHHPAQWARVVRSSLMLFVCRQSTGSSYWNLGRKLLTFSSLLKFGGHQCMINSSIIIRWLPLHKISQIQVTMYFFWSGRPTEIDRQQWVIRSYSWTLCFWKQTLPRSRILQEGLCGHARRQRDGVVLHLTSSAAICERPGTDSHVHINHRLWARDDEMPRQMAHGDYVSLQIRGAHPTTTIELRDELCEQESADSQRYLYQHSPQKSSTTSSQEEEDQESNGTSGTEENDRSRSPYRPESEQEEGSSFMQFRADRRASSPTHSRTEMLRNQALLPRSSFKYVPRPGNGMDLNKMDDCFPIAGFHIVVDYLDNKDEISTGKDVRSTPVDTFPPRSGVEFPSAVLFTFQQIFHGECRTMDIDNLPQLEWHEDTMNLLATRAHTPMWPIGQDVFIYTDGSAGRDRTNTDSSEQRWAAWAYYSARWCYNLCYNELILPLFIYP